MSDKKIVIEPKLSPYFTFMSDESLTNNKVTIADVQYWLIPCEEPNEWLAKHTGFEPVGCKYICVTQYDTKLMFRLQNEWSAMAHELHWVQCPCCTEDIPSTARIGKTLGSLSMLDNSSMICDSCADAEIEWSNKRREHSSEFLKHMRALSSGKDPVYYGLISSFLKLVKSNFIDSDEFDEMMTEANELITQEHLGVSMKVASYEIDDPDSLDGFISAFYMGVCCAIAVEKAKRDGVTDDQANEQMKLIMDLVKRINKKE